MGDGAGAAGTATSTRYRNPPGVNWDPPAGYDAVPGTWYDPQGGYLVELRDDGTDSTITGSTELADSGTWTVDPPVTRLTMVSGAGLAGRVARGTGSSSTTCGQRTSAASPSRATSDATTATWPGRAPGGSAWPRMTGERAMSPRLEDGSPRPWRSRS